MSDSGSNEGSGCGGCIVTFLAIAAVVAAVISIAAVVDPFDWMPSLHDVWADCDDDYATERDECELATRYPGFWGHAVVNFAYAVAAAAAMLWLARTALELRSARRERFEGEVSVARYETARGAFTLAAVTCGALAAVPLIAAAL